MVLGGGLPRLAVEMPGGPNTLAAREQLFELALQGFEWRRPQVVAVQFDQVEAKSDLSASTMRG
jgi:hypothetical protein